VHDPQAQNLQQQQQQQQQQVCFESRLDALHSAAGCCYYRRALQLPSPQIPIHGSTNKRKTHQQHMFNTQHLAASLHTHLTDVAQGEPSIPFYHTTTTITESLGFLNSIGKQTNA
jgi:hypothetical protein